MPAKFFSSHKTFFSGVGFYYISIFLSTGMLLRTRGSVADFLPSFILLILFVSTSFVNDKNWSLIQQQQLSSPCLASLVMMSIQAVLRGVAKGFFEPSSTKSSETAYIVWNTISINTYIGCPIAYWNPSYSNEPNQCIVTLFKHLVYNRFVHLPSFKHVRKNPQPPKFSVFVSEKKQCYQM